MGFQGKVSKEGKLGGGGPSSGFNPVPMLPNSLICFYFWFYTTTCCKGGLTNPNEAPFCLAWIILEASRYNRNTVLIKRNFLTCRLINKGSAECSEVSPLQFYPSKWLYTFYVQTVYEPVCGYMEPWNYRTVKSWATMVPQICCWALRGLYFCVRCNFTCSGCSRVCMTPHDL